MRGQSAAARPNLDDCSCPRGARGFGYPLENRLPREKVLPEPASQPYSFPPFARM